MLADLQIIHTGRALLEYRPLPAPRAFPAIEALAFAVIEMRDWERWEWDYKMNPLPPEQDYNPMTYMKYGPPTRA